VFNRTVLVNAIPWDSYRNLKTSRQYTLLRDQPLDEGGSDLESTPLEFFVSLAGFIITVSHIITIQCLLLLKNIEVHVEYKLADDVLH